MFEELLSFGSNDASRRLVMLHGWGADAEDLFPLGKELVAPLGKTEVVSLQAPEAHPDGFGRQWYGLFPSDWSAAQNSIKQLQLRLKKYLPSKDIPLERTVLLGFSQGGAMALAAGSELPVAGLICCSAYPHPGWMPSVDSPKLFLTHGNKDPIVPIDASKKILNAYLEKQLEVDIDIFDGGHEINQGSILKIQTNLAKWLT